MFKDFFIDMCQTIITGIANNSYYICLFICMGALLLYVSGSKKSGKYVSISFVIYVLLQVIKGALV